MKLSIRGDILKICISGKAFPFHRDAKYILEYWIEEVNQSKLVSSLFIK